MIPSPSSGRGMLRTYGFGVALISLLTVLVAVLVAGRAPASYSSTATVLVESKATSAGVGVPLMGNEKQVAESGRVAEMAAERLGLGDGADDALRAGLTVTVPVDTTVLRIGYVSTDPGHAYSRAVAFSDAYVQFRNSQKTQQVARLVSPPSQTDQGSARAVGVLVAVGLLAGAALGCGLVWAWDRLRDRFRSPADLARHSGVPVVGRVPRLNGDLDVPWSGPRTRRAFSHVAVRVLTGLGNPRHGVVVLVSSPRASAGTTTVAFELAASLAALGRRVALVDARPGQGGLGYRLDHATDPGLGDVLSHGKHVDQVVVATPVPRLTLVPPGATIAAGEIDVDAIRTAMRRLATGSIVVVDGPPLLEDAGALVLADRADAVLLVGDETRGTRADALAAVQLLAEAADRSSSWVVNRPARSRRSRRRPTTPRLAPGPGPSVGPATDSSARPVEPLTGSHHHT